MDWARIVQDRCCQTLPCHQRHLYPSGGRTPPPSFVGLHPRLSLPASWPPAATHSVSPDIHQHRFVASLVLPLVQRGLMVYESAPGLVPMSTLMVCSPLRTRERRLLTFHFHSSSSSGRCWRYPLFVSSCLPWSSFSSCFVATMMIWTLGSAADFHR